jgi:hypothetical protein
MQFGSDGVLVRNAFTHRVQATYAQERQATGFRVSFV